MLREALGIKVGREWATVEREREALGIEVGREWATVGGVDDRGRRKKRNGG